jgi:hypothetical protein
MAWGAWYVQPGGGRSEGEPHDACDGVQVGAARGAWGCRKVPCVEHNGEKVLGDVLVGGQVLSLLLEGRLASGASPRVYGHGARLELVCPLRCRYGNGPDGCRG